MTKSHKEEKRTDNLRVLGLIIKECIHHLNTKLLMNTLQHLLVALALGSIYQKKPSKWSIKIYGLVTNKTYTFNFEIYPGLSHNIFIHVTINQMILWADFSSLKLICIWHLTTTFLNRVQVDQWISCKNKAKIHKKLQFQNRQLYSTIFRLRKHTVLVSYIAKKIKLVL